MGEELTVLASDGGDGASVHPPLLSDHRYNDDLLLKESVRVEAKAEFPLIFHLLDFPQLREVFAPLDERANRAKRRSHNAGFTAVVLATMSLIGLAAEPLWGHVRDPFPRILAAVSALIGILAVLVGAVGILHGTRKACWLRDRFYTERLRQWYFQYFICKLPEIAASTDRRRAGQREEFLRGRERLLSQFVVRETGQLDSDLAAVLDPNTPPEIWLHEPFTGHLPPTPQGEYQAEVFRAYRKLRFNEQIGYCEHKLRSSELRLSFSSLPLRQHQKLLRGTWLVAFVALVALHVSILGIHLLTSKLATTMVLHVGVISFALLALAARTLQEGFALPREIERYEDYR